MRFDNVIISETLELIEQMIATRRPHYAVTANVDFVVQAQTDIELRRIFFEAHLVLCDGTPLVWASRLLGNRLRERVAGADIVPLLIQLAERKRYRFDRWTLDVPRRALLDEAGSETALATAEFRLLHALVTRPGVVLTRDQLLDITAGRAAQVFDRSIDNLVSRLRKRIERDPQQPSLIRTVWGDGYMFAAAVEDSP